MEKLVLHYRVSDIEEVLHNHILKLGRDTDFFEDIGNNLFRDAFGAPADE